MPLCCHVVLLWPRRGDSCWEGSKWIPQRVGVISIPHRLGTRRLQTPKTSTNARFQGWEGGGSWGSQRMLGTLKTSLRPRFRGFEHGGGG